MKNPCERKGQGSSQRLGRFARESRFARFANMRTLGVATVAVGSLAVLPTLARANASAAVTLPVWDQIESIGYKFVSSYEGVSVGQDGVVNVYATSAGQPSIASALSAGGVTNAAYRLVPVAHSLADLQNLTQKLDTDQDSLRALGIDMIEWGPSVDPSVDTVSVEIADYTAAAAADLQNRYGGSGWVSVKPWIGPTQGVLDANRYYETRPFHGGDRIFENTNLHLPACTSGFTLVGNNTGNYFTTEAAHCANGGLNPVWSTLDESGDPSTDRGYISTNYLTNGDEFDVASFSCNCIGAVWSEGPTIGHNQGTTQDIIGWCDCDPIVGGDELVSFDGATTGQVPDAIVDEKDVCLSSTFFGDGYRRCYMNRARSTSTICQEGDSGGPVYQRAPNYTAYATGTIIGQLQSGGTQYCWYARMRHIINTLNVSLP